MKYWTEKNFVIAEQSILVKFDSFKYFYKVNRIINSLSSFMIEDSRIQGSTNLLHISENQILCSINDVEHKFCNIADTDVYIIVYLYIYSVLNECNIFGVHSVVLSKDDNCILILGDFGSGKTTLSWELKRQGWEILSADQSFVFLKNNQMYFYKGSNIAAYNGEYLTLCPKQIAEDIKIKNIIILKGLADCGQVEFKRNKNINHAYKVMWRYMTWPWNTLLVGDFCQSDFLKNKYYCNLSNYLSRLNPIRFWEVRGDSKNISILMNEILGRKYD